MLAVSDTGCGMPPEVIARAFEPFFTTKPERQLQPWSQLRNEPLRVIFASGYGDTGGVEKTAALAGAIMLVKPYDLTAIRAALGQIAVSRQVTRARPSDAGPARIP